MSHSSEYKMPPVGVTETRYILGGNPYVRYSVRCDAEGCWFIGGKFATKSEAELYLADHKAGGRNFTRPCPAPPRRESLPSGLANVEKLWRELDDVVEQLSNRCGYRDWTFEQAQGYAKGLAFSIVMLEPVHFEDIESVSAHARDRRRMRLGQMEYAPTPTSLGHNATTVEVEGLHPTKPTPLKLAPQIESAIRAALSSGMFSAEDMASMYNVPVSTVKALA